MKCRVSERNQKGFLRIDRGWRICFAARNFYYSINLIYARTRGVSTTIFFSSPQHARAWKRCRRNFAPRWDRGLLPPHQLAALAAHTLPDVWGVQLNDAIPSRIRSRLGHQPPCFERLTTTWPSRPTGPGLTLATYGLHLLHCGERNRCDNTVELAVRYV
jgi:hypothetical protein